MRETILDRTINSTMTEQEQYSYDCRSEVWTLPQFAALLELLPFRKYEKLILEKKENVAQNEVKKLKKANRLLKQLKASLQAEMNDYHLLIDEEIHMSPWRLIKWVAENNIPVKKRFFYELPFYLMEIYFSFLPSGLEAPKHTRKYHCEYYLKHARAVIAASTKRLTRKEIYDHPRMNNALRWIRQCGGRYAPRTIQFQWLKKVDPRKRGRPSNSSK